MFQKKLTAIIFFIALECFSQNKATISKVLQTIEPNRIQAKMTFLADDLLQGRQPGTKGFALASKYIESELLSIGLQPGANNASYIQKVPLLKGIVNKLESQFILKIGENESTLTSSVDYLLRPNLNSAISEVNAPLVFVGFGVSAPELGYDDYKNIDAKDKIVVVFHQAPSKFANNERAYFGRLDTKIQTAVDHGAIGIITIEKSDITSKAWNEIARRLDQGNYKWLDAESKPHNAFEKIKISATINGTTAEKLFLNSGKNIQEVLNLVKSGIPQSFPFEIQAKIKVATNRMPFESNNLIGIIPGSDPVLKDEYLVYASHYDHFGVSKPVNGDSIYNGAHDNAAGVSIILEIARTYSKLPVKPKRSIVFAFLTGEELGLLGSDYFVNNPTLKGNIIANISMDMPFFFHQVLDIVPYGAEHSSLKTQVQAAAKKLQIKISPDPIPEEGVFMRSDHFSFVKKGIPSLFIKSGFMTTSTDTVNREITDKAWRANIYHTPQDDMSQAFDFNAAATHVKINFLIGLFTANATDKPSWNSGDFFGGKFGRK